MPLDPTQGRDLTTRLAALYSATELALLQALAELIVEGIDDDAWASRQSEQVLRMRQVAERLVAHLNEAAIPLIEAAIVEAARRGVDAADEDLDALTDEEAAAAGVTPAAAAAAGVAAVAAGAAATSGGDAPRRTTPTPPVAPRTRTAIHDAWTTLARINQQLPSVAGVLYQQVATEIQRRDHTAVPRTTPHTGGILGAPRATGTRLDAAQQALDTLTARGITGFRDRAGRNWNLVSYLEMASRTIVNNEMRDAHTARMIERGQTLVVVSSHANPAPQCQPYEGQVLSLDGETGQVRRESARTGSTVRVRIKATLAEARSRGLFHPHCGHALSAYIPGASKTYTTKPDPEGYAETQHQRYLERQVRDAKRRAAVAVTEQARRAQNARIRAYQKRLREHTQQTGLARRPRREQIHRAI